MNKKERKFKINIKVLLAFILGLLLSVTGACTAAILFNSNEVSYNNTTSGLTSTNVQSAIDELSTKANNMVPIDPDTFTTNAAKTVYTSSKGVCIKRNDMLNCFKINNWEEEQNHIQEVFSDISCNVKSSYVLCNASDFFCNVHSIGRVSCSDNSDDSTCTVKSDGSVKCY